MPVQHRPPGLRARPTRSDARRNFDRLVVAAEEVFAEQGTDAPLDDIAKRAGVGSGTLYRHFATRDELLTTVFWERISTVCAEGDALLEAEPPLQALTNWLRRLMSLTMQKGLAEALMAQNEDEANHLFRSCHDALTVTAGALLRAAQDSGDARPDVELEDLLHLCHSIASHVDPDKAGAEDADRMLRLLIEGLRTR